VFAGLPVEPQQLFAPEIRVFDLDQLGKMLQDKYLDGIHKSNRSYLIAVETAPKFQHEPRSVDPGEEQKEEDKDTECTYQFVGNNVEIAWHN
jgi:hypothetical protein